MYPNYLLINSDGSEPLNIRKIIYNCVIYIADFLDESKSTRPLINFGASDSLSILLIGKRHSLKKVALAQILFSIIQLGRPDGGKEGILSQNENYFF